jgi:hypothetical protein
MHAEDHRYAEFFLFVEEEVALLCKAHKQHHVRRHEPRIQGDSSAIYWRPSLSSWVFLHCKNATMDIQQGADSDLSSCLIPSLLLKHWNGIAFVTFGSTLVPRFGKLPYLSS